MCIHQDSGFTEEQELPMDSSQDPLPSPTELAYYVGDHIFTIHESTKGYDSSFYHSDCSESAMVAKILMLANI